MDIQKLKQMISEPASKQWFKKHGTPKVKKNPKQLALNKHK